MASLIIGGTIGGLAYAAGATWIASSAWGAMAIGASVGYKLFGGRRKEKYLFDESSMNTWSEGVPIPVIYGEVPVTGNVIYKRVSADSKRLYMAVAFGEGELTSIKDVWADGEPLGDLDGYVQSALRLGTDDQEPVSWLFTKNRKNDGTEPVIERWKNTAYVALEFEASTDIWSLPTISAILEGTKINVLGGDGKWTKKYNRNPIWCLYDFMTNKRYGVGLKPSMIDIISWKNAADYCDELVDGDVRFRLDIAIEDQQSSLDLIDALLSTCRGHLIFSEGKIRVQIDKDEIPVQAFSPQNIIKDSFSVSEVSKNDVPNQIVVEWLDPESDWALTSTEWNDEIDQEDRDIVSQSIELKGITRASQAGRMARFILDSLTRCKKSCQFGVGVDALACEVGDVIKVSHFVPGWHDKLFKIIQIEETEQDEMTIVAREHDPLIYHDRGVASQSQYIPAEPDPVEPPGVPTNVVAVAIKVGSQVMISVEWDPVSHPYGVRYEVLFRPGTTTNDSVLTTTETSATIPGVAAGESTYIVRVRAISNIANQQGWTSEPLEVDLANPALLPSESLLPGTYLYPVE
ncbi:MAG: phage tail protein [Bacillota bacterium]|nr:phage tail protein [Bacillota bacterium]